MFPPEPEKPWWYHLIWALPCMAATGMLGYWLKKPGTLEVEKVVKVPEIVYRTNTVRIPVANTPPPARPGWGHRAAHSDRILKGAVLKA